MDKRESKSCTYTHERETWKRNEKRNKYLILIINEKGVLVFKQCVT